MRPDRTTLPGMIWNANLVLQQLLTLLENNKHDRSSNTDEDDDVDQVIVTLRYYIKNSVALVMSSLVPLQLLSPNIIFTGNLGTGILVCRSQQLYQPTPPPPPPQQKQEQEEQNQDDQLQQQDQFAQPKGSHDLFFGEWSSTPIPVFLTQTTVLSETAAWSAGTLVLFVFLNEIDEESNVVSSKKVIKDTNSTKRSRSGERANPQNWVDIAVCKDGGLQLGIQHYNKSRTLHNESSSRSSTHKNADENIPASTVPLPFVSSGSHNVIVVSLGDVNHPHIYQVAQDVWEGIVISVRDPEHLPLSSTPSPPIPLFPPIPPSSLLLPNDNNDVEMTCDADTVPFVIVKKDDDDDVKVTNDDVRIVADHQLDDMYKVLNSIAPPSTVPDAILQEVGKCDDKVNCFDNKADVDIDTDTDDGLFTALVERTTSQEEMMQMQQQSSSDQRRESFAASVQDDRASDGSNFSVSLKSDICLEEDNVSCITDPPASTVLRNEPFAAFVDIVDEINQSNTVYYENSPAKDQSNNAKEGTSILTNILDDDDDDREEEDENKWMYLDDIDVTNSEAAD